MTATDNITLTKGSFSVIVHTVGITDNYDNKIQLIIPAQTKQKQDAGPKDTKVIDLLRITHEMVIQGILETESERDDLISIAKGANVTGTPITMTYNTHPDTPLNVFITKLMIKEDARNKSSASEMRYEVQITLIEGV